MWTWYLQHPGRVLAVYIRNVSRDAGRIVEIERLAAAVAAAGSSLVLAADSAAMAKHAVSFGLIAPEGRGAVSTERASANTIEVAAESHRVGGNTATVTSQKVADGELRDILEQGLDTPLNVVVEPADRGRWSAPSDTP